MRRIVEGKLYDTEKAEEICNDSYSNRGDFHYYDETLYKTKNGRYFTAGEGGPLSKYARAVGQNETSGSSGIFPLSKEEAFDFCQRVDSECCIKFFPDMIQEA